MKRLLKILLVVVAVAFVAIQFFRPRFSNPPLVPGQSIEEATIVPAEVQTVLARSCNDCHSNLTRYPWYSQVSPLSWFLAGHIEAGRLELNFSEWASYPISKQKRKLEEICQEVESGEMPLNSYLWVHRAAVLTAAERRMVCEWTNVEQARLSTGE